PDGRPAHWCDFDKKWGNHTTEECYNRMRFARQQQMVGGMQGYAPVGERPLPVVLEAQPPLPTTTPIKLLDYEEDENQERALVMMMP
ncbi:hypothetical protein, partial [Escherichia coli]|uniref:hypothetical protein n=1 Tax=Escherichia coli TaxID=562 RepID=UPI001AD92CBE